MKIFCFDPGKGRNILAGKYNSSDYTFIKKVNKRHFMVIEKSYGISEEVLQQLKKLGCVNIMIITKKGIQLSLLGDWLKRPIKNYGHGFQRFGG
jgi:hypothetical protein